MAVSLDPSVELSLIQQRFPDIAVSKSGALVSDFFCARKVGTRRFEGRLFLTEKAVFFVSTFSDAHDFDLYINLSDVLLVTAFCKNILPAVEFSLKGKDELFTNFYNLSVVVTSLTSLLPRKVLENKSNGSQRKLNRLLSVPARQRRSPTPPHTTHTHTPTPPPAYEAVIREDLFVVKTPVCPFFSKCGFCPRFPLCKLQHEPITPLKQDHTHLSTSIHYGNSYSFLSPSKRMHLLEQPELVQTLSGTASTKKSSVEYNRSLSSPAKVLTFPAKGSETSPQRAATDSAIDKDRGSVQATDRESERSTNPALLKLSKEDTHEPSLVVPPSFDFGVEGQSANGQEDDEETVKVKGERDDNMFVFTASNPSSPDVGSKRRNAGVTFRFPGKGGVSGVEGAKVDSDESLAMLAQQLELGADTDSLTGDLDMDYQRRLLADFGGTSDLPPGWADVPSPPPLPMLSGAAAPFRGHKEGEVKEGGPHKRRHCLYFLAGHCPRGPDCPEYHGVVPDNYDDLEAMISEDDFSTIEIPSRLKVYPASTLGRGDMNSGDKIILSPHVLLACEQQELSYPIAFRLEHPTTGRVVHAGVLEFTSSSMDHGYLPQWMVDHLGVGEGEEVEFRHVELPKGQFVRLQPVSSAWLGIQYDKRLAMMEFQLRNFQTLTEGTKVTLTYELNKYTLKVLECKPAKGISIVDADITTDVVEPADFNRYHSIEDGQAVNTSLDEPTKCSKEENTYRHFVLLSLPGQPLPPGLRVVVTSSRGDADLFLSQSCTAPTQARYTWCDQSVGESVISLSSQGGDYDINKSLYAGVVSLCDETEFTITFHTHQTSHDSNDTTGSLLGTATGRSTHEATPTSEPSETTPPGHGRCAYCGSVMPNLKLIMHERHCAQSTFKCPLCKVCVPKSAEKKHHFIAHEPLKCECGTQTTQVALHEHQITDCPKKSVQCPFKWCNLSFPMDQLQNHENLCGRKKVPCPMCTEEVSQLELEIHLEAFHFVDTARIDWTLPLANQTTVFKPVEPKFKCTCGAGFDFEDDYQVHQLTECKKRQDQGDVETEIPCDDVVGYSVI